MLWIVSKDASSHLLRPLPVVDKISADILECIVSSISGTCIHESHGKMVQSKLNQGSHV